MRARHYDPNMGRFIQEDPIGTSDDINLYRYVANNPMKYVDRMGLEKQLLEDIKNGNTFTVSLVGRNLQKFPTVVGTHTFIMIDSKNSKGISRTYTIGGQNIDGKLEGIFNEQNDVINWNGLFAGGSIKSSLTIPTPTGMSDVQFVQNIYDEYIDYNSYNQVEFNLFSKPFWGNDSGNCSNLASTILLGASDNDSTVQDQLDDYDNLGFDWGIGEKLY